MKILLSALLALPLLAASGATLADHDHDHGHGHNPHDWHDDDQDHGRGWHDDDHHDNGWHGRGHDQGWHGHGRHWERGHRYDGPVVVIRDYRTYRLREPPRGYHWVRDDDNNFVLVAVATGIILDAVFH